MDVDRRVRARAERADAAVSSSAAIETRGVEKAVSDLHRLGDRASDIRRLSERVRSVYRQSNERQFARAPWPPLAPATLERKRRQGLDPRPERATGALYRALTAARAKGQVDQRERTEFRFGTDLPYAAAQQGSKTQPRRDLIALSYDERKQIEDMISRFIAKERNW